MKKRSPRTTLMGIFALISTGLSAVSIAMHNPTALTDPSAITGILTGIATGIGLIRAADNQTLNQVAGKE